MIDQTEAGASDAFEGQYFIHEGIKYHIVDTSANINYRIPDEHLNRHERRKKAALARHGC